MKDINEILSANLNQLMKKHNENLSKLSDSINVAYSTVSDWQHGRKMPRAGSLEKIANHYNVNISYLTTDHELNNEPTSVDTAIDNMQSYQGKPISDDQKEIIRDLVKGYLDRDMNKSK